MGCTIHLYTISNFAPLRHLGVQILQKNFIKVLEMLPVPVHRVLMSRQLLLLGRSMSLLESSLSVMSDTSFRVLTSIHRQ